MTFRNSTDVEEDVRTEFKTELKAEHMKTVVAFSNTVGGTLYIGINDDGVPIGVDDVDSVSLKAVQLLSSSIRPDVLMTSNVSHIVMDEKDVVAIDVREGTSKPYYLRDKGYRPEGVYIRMGPSSVQATEAQILKMVRESSATFESLVSFEQNLTFDTAEKVFAEAGVKFGRNQMTSLGLLSGESYTNLAYLMSDQCTSGVKLAAYSNRNKREFLDRTEVHGSVLTQVQEALGFLSKYNPLRSRISGIRRTDFRAYPEHALREALTNAVVHRDYSMDADTLVSVFDDGITIASYGGLKRGLGLDDLLIGISSPRNPKLASVFYRLGFIESYGTGIPRMMDDYRNALTKPAFELTTNVFKVSLPARRPAASNQPLVDDVLVFASTHERFSRSELESVLDSSGSKVGAVLTSMVEEGLLEKVGGGRSTKYRLAKRRRPRGRRSPNRDG